MAPFHGYRRARSEEDRRELRRATRRKWERKTRHRKQLREKYNLTEADYDAQNLKQKGLCAICRKPPKAPWTRLGVDHDHATKLFRGLLCNRCNRVLGQLEDRPDLFRAAARYLTKGFRQC